MSQLVKVVRAALMVRDGVDSKEINLGVDENSARYLKLEEAKDRPRERSTDESRTWTGRGQEPSEWKV